MSSIDDLEFAQPGSYWAFDPSTPRRAKVSNPSSSSPLTTGSADLAEARLLNSQRSNPDLERPGQLASNGVGSHTQAAARSASLPSPHREGHEPQTARSTPSEDSDSVVVMAPITHSECAAAVSLLLTN